MNSCEPDTMQTNGPKAKIVNSNELVIIEVAVGELWLSSTELEII